MPFIKQYIPKMLTRIAPTPSGFLHQGNIFSFFLTRSIATKYGGQLLLRIDDLDNERTRQEYLEDIFAALNHLGIGYDFGPVNAEDFNLHYSQKLRLANYHHFLNTLAQTGLMYACTCSRKQLNKLAFDGLKRCHCRSRQLPLETKDASLKVFVPDELCITFKDALFGPVSIGLFDLLGDFVVRRKDGIPAYQVASLCDDFFYGVNYIVRGEDLLASTAAQLYLAQLSQYDFFLKCTFLHHPLERDLLGNKLSKSAGNASNKGSLFNATDFTRLIEEAEIFAGKILNKL